MSIIELRGINKDSSLVYLLLGEDKGAKDEFLQLLKKKVFKTEDSRNLNVSFFYGDRALAEDIIENLTTFSFFSDPLILVCTCTVNLVQQRLN